MKTRNLIVTAIVILFNVNLHAQVAISPDGSTADDSAMLDVKSSDKGFLPPRMTEAEKLAILNPVEGLIIYQTDMDKGVQIYTGTKWDKVIQGSTSPVPIGSVIDWWRPSVAFPVPDGYVICDGSILVDAESPYNNATLPDLSDVFIRGTTILANIGEIGGSPDHHHNVDPAAENTSTSGDHQHTVDPSSISTSTIGNHTHVIDPPYTVTNSGGAHDHVWATFDFNERWIDGAGNLIIDWQDGIDSEGVGVYPLARDNTTNNLINHKTDYQSSHNHGVNFNPFFSEEGGGHNHTVNIGITNSSSNGSHSHSYDVPSTQSSTTGHLPPYVGLLKIMRIK